MGKREKRAFMGRFMAIAVLAAGSFVCLGTEAFAVRALDPTVMKEETAKIERVLAERNVDNFIWMLALGGYESRSLALKHLEIMGVQRVLEDLERLNAGDISWISRWSSCDLGYQSGAFAVAICLIQTRDLSSEQQVSALFELSEGKGPAVPQFVKDAKNKKWEKSSTYIFGPSIRPVNAKVGRHVARVLADYDDPRIIPHLRKSKNRGVATMAVQLEVRDLAPAAAVERCLQIAHYEPLPQRDGAIQCLYRFGDPGTDALKSLVKDGFDSILRTLKDRMPPSEYETFLAAQLVENDYVDVRGEAVGELYMHDWRKDPNGKSISYTSEDESMILSLIMALRDPAERVRNLASGSLAYDIFRRSSSGWSEAVKQGLRSMAGHEDPKVAERIMEIFTTQGWIDRNVRVMAPPVMRTDLSVKRGSPASIYHKRRQQARPLELKAKKALDYGSPQEAIKLYGQLLELVPKFYPYVQAIETAKQYEAAAQRPQMRWDPSAFYYGIRGRYEYLLAKDPNDISVLTEIFDLAAHLPCMISQSALQSLKPPERKSQMLQDFHRKGRHLFQRVIDHAPPNEYISVASHFRLGCSSDPIEDGGKAQIEAFLHVLAIPPASIVSSTSASGKAPSFHDPNKTQTQYKFEQQIQERVIASLDRYSSSPGLHFGRGSGGLVPLYIDSKTLRCWFMEACVKAGPQVVEKAQQYRKTRIAELKRRGVTRE